MDGPMKSPFWINPGIMINAVRFLVEKVMTARTLGFRNGAGWMALSANQIAT